jgi:Zn-dependent alcohol dehydrogenase
MGAERIIAIDMVQGKLARAEFSATDLVSASDGNAIGAVMELSEGKRLTSRSR